MVDSNSWNKRHFFSTNSTKVLQTGKCLSCTPNSTSDKQRNRQFPSPTILRLFRPYLVKKCCASVICSISFCSFLAPVHIFSMQPFFLLPGPPNFLSLQLLHAPKSAFIVHPLHCIHHCPSAIADFYKLYDTHNNWFNSDWLLVPLVPLWVTELSLSCIVTLWSAFDWWLILTTFVFLLTTETPASILKKIFNDPWQCRHAHTDKILLNYAGIPIGTERPDFFYFYHKRKEII